MTATVSLNTVSGRSSQVHVKDLIVSPMICQVLQNIPPIETFGHYGKYANCPKMAQKSNVLYLMCLTLEEGRGTLLLNIFYFVQKFLFSFSLCALILAQKSQSKSGSLPRVDISVKTSVSKLKNPNSHIFVTKKHKHEKCIDYKNLKQDNAS